MRVVGAVPGRLCYALVMMRLMTTGVLARRSGMSVKAIREYADAGLIYTQGRSPAGYRLFAEEALWCVRVIDGLRSLGLTVLEIRGLGESGEPVGPQLARLLSAAKARTADLQQLLARIEAFEGEHRSELAGEVAFDTGDPRGGTAPAVDSPPGGRP